MAGLKFQDSKSSEAALKYVVYGGKSTRAVTQRARQELAAVGAKIFGVVLNNVDMRREGYDEYYYQRYYSNYGHNEEAPQEGH